LLQVAAGSADLELLTSLADSPSANRAVPKNTEVLAGLLAHEDYRIRTVAARLVGNWKVSVKTKALVAAWTAHLVRSVEADGPVETLVVGENEAWRFGAVKEPTRHLDRLVRGWHEIREWPPPLFERASREYAEHRHGEGWSGDPVEAQKKAKKAYIGGYNTSAEREEDPYVALCFRERDPLVTPDFEKWAQCLWRPILFHGEVLS